MTNWIQRWQQNKIGWHRNNFNQRLINLLPELKLISGSVIFVPLCGKSLDMLYLINNKFKIIAVEISKIAIESFFKENNLDYVIIKQENIDIYQNDNIKIYCTSFFNLQKKFLKKITAVYDRASLVAFNKADRIKYIKHLNYITPNNIQILLLTLNYQQNKISGPPFAVSYDEIKNNFNNYSIKQLESFNDIENEEKFKQNSLKFIMKESYLLKKNEILK